MPPHDPAWSGGERRNVAARIMLRRRFEDEYRELPGLSLTTDQAARLFALPEDVCGRVFGELVRAGVLTRQLKGQYVVAIGSRYQGAKS